ncbi:acetyl-CoA carboxylase biotin carboxylase subunit [Streptomyces sp. NBC_01239]|uniref:acetyl-CoA carboxylase biotin carboxylase subunit n=1 Tax=Streptomyces sp. NBC_01239 TaxID=2903792 RepID=UPI0022583467|nr:acetyl-CoA carboxylase biotin carboxylase subunit [Streptomyces sp. NBC_01239]MCX4816343.1 acetyl-CoA carboxylase biotin carboxylase subunit [Streptomyces sp. NBC_01239]
MFRKILVANRGEIAVRVVRACRELGIPSVAVHSTADADAEHVRLADESVHIGPAPARRSYLHIPNVVSAALRAGADAIHPGYGFLSEDPYFAEICASNGITFIGPPPDVMEAVGDKASARRLMTEAGLPLLPGTADAVAGPEEALAVAGELGYPVVVKALAGGGGRGIAVAGSAAELAHVYLTTRAHAQAVFGDSRVYVERFLPVARHIEIQVLADAHGNAVHLGERDCSVQRRHQKLIEESPSPALDDQLRGQIGEAALLGTKALGYCGAGTMEFLLDDDGRFWFMEMNARIQVEHPVTEMVCGIDLVQQQILVAAGAPLELEQADINLRGHAVEVRINAEDPDRQFAPTPGTLTEFRLPAGPGVRVDTHCVPGSSIPAHYDSLIAKLVVWAQDRPAALNRMRRALGEVRVEGAGVRTTVPFHQRVLDHPVFRSGDAHTDFLTRHLEV